ncbi:importin subunit alpha-8 [Anaeramoeba flamelloides]|uniref:Importin subunit alpha-8 n=1 Tax=Anaeramoeba flamelloides TaxID=1746091 RepID=A0ABQ8YD09_9EUKA|nr:importin subunit alpha-8 [Anaeramoeba flamelloides]
MSRLDKRKKLFKKTLDYETAKTKRIQSLLEQSKSKTEQILDRKRKIVRSYEQSMVMKEDPDKWFENGSFLNLQGLIDWMSQVKTGTIEEQNKAIKCIRILLSCSISIPYEKILQDTEFIKALMQAFKKSTAREFLLNSAWIFTNLIVHISNQNTTNELISKIPFLLGCDLGIAELVNILIFKNKTINKQSISNKNFNSRKRFSNHKDVIKF